MTLWNLAWFGISVVESDEISSMDDLSSLMDGGDGAGEASWFKVWDEISNSRSVLSDA